MLVCECNGHLMTYQGFFATVCHNIGIRIAESSVDIDQSQAQYIVYAMYQSLRNGQLASYVDRHMLKANNTAINTLKYITLSQVSEMAEQTRIMSTIAWWTRHCQDKKAVLSFR